MDSHSTLMVYNNYCNCCNRLYETACFLPLQNILRVSYRIGYYPIHVMPWYSLNIINNLDVGSHRYKTKLNRVPVVVMGYRNIQWDPTLTVWETIDNACDSTVSNFPVNINNLNMGIWEWGCSRRVTKNRGIP